MSGVNVMKDGKGNRLTIRTTPLMYSMTRYDERLQTATKGFADEMNKVLPDGIVTQFKDVSIVEIGFMGNVLREFYRISLVDGSALGHHHRQAVSIGQ